MGSNSGSKVIAPLLDLIVAFLVVNKFWEETIPHYYKNRLFLRMWNLIQSCYHSVQKFTLCG